MLTEKKPKQKKAVEQAPANHFERRTKEFFEDYELIDAVDALQHSSQKILDQQGDTITLSQNDVFSICANNRVIKFLIQLHFLSHGK